MSKRYELVFKYEIGEKDQSYLDSLRRSVWRLQEDFVTNPDLQEVRMEILQKRDSLRVTLKAPDYDPLIAALKSYLTKERMPAYVKGYADEVNEVLRKHNKQAEFMFFGPRIIKDIKKHHGACSDITHKL